MYSRGKFLHLRPHFYINRLVVFYLVVFYFFERRRKKLTYKECAYLMIINDLQSLNKGLQSTLFCVCNRMMFVTLTQFPNYRVHEFSACRAKPKGPDVLRDFLPTFSYPVLPPRAFRNSRSKIKSYSAKLLHSPISQTSNRPNLDAGKSGNKKNMAKPTG